MDPKSVKNITGEQHRDLAAMQEFAQLMRRLGTYYPAWDMSVTTNG